MIFILGWGVYETGNEAGQQRWSGMMEGMWAWLSFHYFYIILQLAAGCFDHYFFTQQEKLCPGV